MKPIYKKYLKTTALVWTGCFVLFLFVYMLILAPQAGSRKMVQKQLAEKEQIYNSALIAARDETKNQMDKDIEDLQDRLGFFVIESEDLANLVFDISQIAKEKQVGSFSIRSKDNRSSLLLPDCQYLSQSNIDLSFTGGFNQFATLLNALERHRPVIFVDKFMITQSSQDDTGHLVDMDLAVFVKKQQKS